MKKGDLFEYCGDMLMIDEITENGINYVGVEFDDEGNAKPYEAIKGFLTKQEMKHIKF